MGFDGSTLKFDISELRDGINQANTLIKTNESEWRKYASVVNDWSSSAEGLQARNDSLNNQLSEQQKKVNAQTKVVEEYTATFGESSEATQKQIQILNSYQTALNKTEKEIEQNTAKIGELNTAEAKEGKTTKELAKENEALIAVRKNHQKTIAETEKKIDALTNATGDHSAEIDTLRKKLAEERKALEEAGGAVDDLADKQEDAEGKTGKFSKALGGLGKIAGGVVAGLGAVAGAVGGAVAGMVNLANSTRDSRATFAKLENNAKTTGKSFDKLTDDLKNVVAVTGDIDAGFEGMNMLSNLKGTDAEISKIANAFAGASAQFDGLKFEGLAEGLQETLATGSAVGPFAELIERTGGDLDSFNNSLAGASDEAGRTQIALDWLAKSGLGEVADSFKEANPALVEARQAEIDLQIATNALGQIAEPLAGKIKAMGASFLTGLLPALEGSSKAFSDLINGVAGADKGLVYNLGYLIGSATATIRGWWEKAKPALDVMFGQVFPMLLDKAVTEIPKLVANIAETLGANAPTILATITGLILSITESIAGAVPDVVNAGITLLSGLIDSVFAVSQTLLDNMPAVIASVVNGLGAGAVNVLEGAGKLFDQIIEALPDFLANLKENLPQIINTIIDKLVEWIPKIFSSAKDLFLKICDAIPDLLILLAKELPQIITKITTTLLARMPEILSMAKDLLGEIIKAIPSVVADLGAKLPEIITAIVKGLTAGASEIYNVGVNILKGVWEGINDTVSWLSDKIASIFGKDGVIVGGIKKLLGIHSPSTVGAELGDYFMQGIEDGLAGRAKTTEEVAEEAVTGVVAGASNAINNSSDNVSSSFFDSLKNSFAGGSNQIQGLLSAMMEGAVTGDSSGITSALSSVGDFLTSGLQSVLSSSIPVLGPFIGSLVGGLFKGIKSLFKKNETKQKEKEEKEKQLKEMQEFGEKLAQAQIDGYNSAYETALNNLRTAKKTISEELNGGLSSISLTGAGNNAQANKGNVVYYTQNNYSPKALSAKEIYRNNNRAINMLTAGARA